MDATETNCCTLTIGETSNFSSVSKQGRDKFSSDLVRSFAAITNATTQSNAESRETKETLKKAGEQSHKRGETGERVKREA